MELRLLAISGSSRTGSWNRRLLECAVTAARARGASVEVLDLAALELPLYHGDIESATGVPPSARQLRDAMAATDGLLLATPEYNGFPTPLLINAFDWLSRLPAEDGRPSGLAVTANRPVGLLSASTGPFGGVRSIGLTRQYLSMALQMMPVPPQVMISRANEAFDDAGALKDPKAQTSLEAVVDRLLRVARALKA